MEAQGRLGGWLQPRTLHALLAFATLATFAVALRGELIEWDDDINILDNAQIHSMGLSNVRWMFTDLEQAMRYKALSWLAWALVFRAGGTGGFGYHALTLVLHVVNAALAFDLFSTLLGRARPAARGAGPIAAGFFAAAAWALNPVRSEVLGWATALPYAQGTFFALLSARWYAAGLEGDRRALTLSGVAFLLSVMTYPVAMMLPGALLLLDLALAPDARALTRVRRLGASALISMLTLGTALVARWAYQARWGRVASIDDFGVLHRAMQALFVWASFVWRPVAPWTLRPLYLDLYARFDPFEGRFLASAILVLTITASLVWARRKEPWLLGCWGAFLVLTVPVLGLTERSHFPAERYMYLGHLPLALGFALLVQRAWASPRARAPAVVLASALILAGAVVAHRRVPQWRDTAAFSAAVRPLLRNQRQVAKFFWREGRALARRGAFADADARYTEAIRLNPSRAEFLLSRAEVRRALGREADAALDLALARDVRARLDRRPGATPRMSDEPR